MNLRNEGTDVGTVTNESTITTSGKKRWERTNVTNLVRNSQSGGYYARVKVNGKEIWKSLKTSTPSIAKLRLADFEKEARAKGLMSNVENVKGGAGETTVERFISIFLARTRDDSTLRPSSKTRREIAVKALRKTWPELAGKDARRVTPTDCQQWGAKALREGTGFVAPQAKTVRKGMSASAFNRTLGTLRAIFDIAKEFGAVYRNPAENVKPARMTQKRLELPSVSQFQAIVKAVAGAGAGQSKDCHDMVRLLAYSGMRVGESNALQWKHVDFTADRITVPGYKTETSWRVIPLFPPLRALLLELKERRGVESVETPVLRIKECKESLRTACKGVGVKLLTHHDLRHLFATRCIELGIDIPTVSRWLGHNDGGALAMKTYGHLRQEHSAAQAARLNFDGGSVS